MHYLVSPWEAAPKRTDDDQALLAVGDVHGCSAQLDGLLRALRTVVQDNTACNRSIELVMLGDYIDRGPDSVGVLQRLPTLSQALGGIPVHCLRGNHDQFLIDHLRPVPHPGSFEMWVWNGGESFMNQLEIDVPEFEYAEDAELSPISDGLRHKLGPELVTQIRHLPTHLVRGGYAFAHAGVAPDFSLAEHTLEEFLWIREPFLHARHWPHPFAVVHGHTPLGPEVYPHRICVDSGSYFTGVVMAVEIVADRLRFHAISESAEPAQFYELIAESRQERRFDTQAMALFAD